MLPIDEMLHIYNRSVPFLCTDRESFRAKVMPEGSRCFGEYVGGALAGFAAVHENGILALCVAPEYQNRGIGQKLLCASETAVRGAGYGSCVLGRSSAGYLCQGVPYAAAAEEPSFFAKRGYSATWSSVDLTLDLRAFSLQNLMPYPAPEGVAFRMARREELPKVRAAAFETEPSWARFYEGTADDVFVAELEGEIVGFVLLLTSGMPFAGNFPGRVGGLACLGVPPGRRGMGIGLWLAAHATQALCERGVDWSYLGYTWLEDWYGRLGYQVYARFWMGEKRL